MPSERVFCCLFTGFAANRPALPVYSPTALPYPVPPVGPVASSGDRAEKWTLLLLIELFQFFDAAKGDPVKDRLIHPHHEWA
jgi:hypothetical protein